MLAILPRICVALHRSRLNPFYVCMQLECSCVACGNALVHGMLYSPASCTVPPCCAGDAWRHGVHLLPCLRHALVREAQHQPTKPPRADIPRAGHQSMRAWDGTAVSCKTGKCSMHATYRAHGFTKSRLAARAVPCRSRHLTCVILSMSVLLARDKWPGTSTHAYALSLMQDHCVVLSCTSVRVICIAVFLHVSCRQR